MRIARYQGWRHDGQSTVVYYDKEETFDLLGVTSHDGFTGTYRVGWGSRCPEAMNLARLLLWHATWDRTIIDDLTELCHDQITSCLPKSWTLHKETIRDWIQKQQPTREMMHGRDPVAKCPGSY